MHWLEEQVTRLHALARPPAAGGPFLSAVRQIVAEIVERDGVSACFVAHEGLIVDARGRARDFDALSAMTQSALTVAEESADALSLGAVQQVLIIGRDHKLALFLIAPVAIGIVSPSLVRLAQVLAR